MTSRIHFSVMHLPRAAAQPFQKSLELRFDDSTAVPVRKSVKFDCYVIISPTPPDERPLKFGNCHLRGGRVRLGA